MKVKKVAEVLPPHLLGGRTGSIAQGSFRIDAGLNEAWKAANVALKTSRDRQLENWIEEWLGMEAKAEVTREEAAFLDKILAAKRRMPDDDAKSLLDYAKRLAKDK